MTPASVSPRPSRAIWAFSALVATLVTSLLLSGCAPETAPTPAPSPSATSKPSPDPSVTPKATAPTTPPAPKLSQAELDNRLRGAAWANDIEAAKALIAQGANVNAKDATVQSAYLIATSEGYTDFLRLTLAHGANVKDLDSWNGTGLIRAAERGHWAVEGELIRAGVPLDHVNRVGYQAIHEVVWFGRDDATYRAAIRALAAGGVQLDRPSVNEGLTPLQMAESKGYASSAGVLRAILQAPAPKDPKAALLAAAAEGNPNAVTVALRAKADPRSTDAAGRTALQLAESGGHFESAQVIRALGG